MRPFGDRTSGAEEKSASGMASGDKELGVFEKRLQCEVRAERGPGTTPHRATERGRLSGVRRNRCALEI